MQRTTPLVHRGVVVDRALVMIVVTIVFWALNITIVKMTVNEWHPLAYSVDRFAVGTALFAAWVWWRERSLRVRRRDLPLLVIAGAIGIAGNQIGFMYAEHDTSATTVRC